MIGIGWYPGRMHLTVQISFVIKKETQGLEKAAATE